MEDVLRTRHSGIIDGLTKLFNLLVTLRYFPATDVRYPPHIAPPVDTAGMAALGFDPEVVALAPLLPQLCPGIVWGFQEEGTALVPRSKAVSYLVRPDDSHNETWERLRVGKNGGPDPQPQLPPTIIRLTDADFGLRAGGVHLLYDTSDQSIIVWSTLHNKDWNEYPRRPSGVVLDEIVGRLQRLEWVPWYNPADVHDIPERKIIETPAYMVNEWPFSLGRWFGISVPLDDDAALLALVRQHMDGDSVNDMRKQINHWRALQKLYRDAGWDADDPSGFDGDRFERARADWIRRFEDIESEWNQRMRTRARQGTVPAEEQLRFDELDQRWEAFWSESAGDRYV